MKSFFAILLGLIMCAAPGALASVSVNVNGSAYTIPQNNEKGWGTSVTSWIQAMSQYTLQANGGAFTLTAETDFGATYGLKGPYFKTETSTPATVGVLRLASTDAVDWRNNANSGNNALTVDSSDNLLYNGNKLIAGALGSIVNADISASAGITRSKLATGTVNQVVINDGSGNLSSEATLAISRGGTALAAVGTANQLFGTNNGATAYEAKAVTVTAAGTLIVPTGQTLQVPDGTVSAPSLTFSSETGSGLYRIGASDIGVTSSGTLGVDVKNIGSSTVNIGLAGAVADANSAVPLTVSRSLNASLYNLFQNTSNGTASSAIWILRSGSSSNDVTLENYAKATSGYLQETGMLSSSSNLLNLNLASEYSAGAIRFNVGGRTLATERMNLSTTTLALNGGVTLTMNGASSGAITVQGQAAAGTYNFNLPTTAGGAGTVLTSQGGGSTAMTWTSPLVSPMTTTGDIIYSSDNSGTAARLAVGASTTYLSGGTTPSYKSFTAHSVTTKTTTGTTTGYRFFISGLTTCPTNGSTCTNNGHTNGYTVIACDSGKANLWAVSSFAPTSGSSTLTGCTTGDATISYSGNTPLATYSTPSTAKALFVRAVGGGGAGGSAATAASSAGAGGGGGGGGYVEKLITSPGATYYYEVGTGGTHGATGNTAGGAGNKTSFVSSDGTVILAGNGGTGGGGSAAINGAQLQGGGVAGGSASGGDVNITGQSGTTGIILSNSQAAGGVGGGTPLSGTCAQNVNGASATGTSGISYGGGGCGGELISAGSAVSGGDGANGVVSVLELYNGN